MKKEGRDIEGGPNNKASTWVHSKSQLLEIDPVGGINGLV